MGIYYIRPSGIGSRSDRGEPLADVIVRSWCRSSAESDDLVSKGALICTHVPDRLSYNIAVVEEVRMRLIGVLHLFLL